MKYQRIIAAAAAAAGSLTAGTAMAQSNVQLYGVLEAFAGRMQVSSAAPPVSNKTLESGGLTTPYWGLRGQEDLGGGLKADFILESFFRLDSGKSGRFDTDVFWARESSVGLSGDFGTIRLGRTTTPLFISMLAFNPLQSGSVFSPMMLHTYVAPLFGSPVARSVAGDTNWNGAVRYESPRFGDFRFIAILGEPNQKNYGGNVIYRSGDFGATLAWQRVGSRPVEFTISGATEQTAILAGASYDFKAVKLFGQFLQSDNEFSTGSSRRTRTTQIGASVPLGGPASLLASWARTKQDLPLLRRDTATVAYDYALSKRTDLYAAYRYDKVTNLNVGNSYAVGVRHSF